MWKKFKSMVIEEQFFMSCLVLLVGVISFGLGRLSVPDILPETSGARVQLAPELFILPSTPTSAVAGASASAATQSGIEMQLVASKSGSRYHALDCPGAKQIKESNKVFFTSVMEAEAARYTKAANCPSL